MNNGAVIHVSPALFLTMVTILAMAGSVSIYSSVKSLHSVGRHGGANHGWYVPVVDSHGHGESFFHQWDVRLKCISLFVYCLCIAFLSRPFAALVALIYSFLAVYVSRLSITKAMKRLRAMFGFLTMFLVILPLTAPFHPGDTLLVIDALHLHFNLRGFMIALTLVMKAAAIALMMEPLFNTAPLTVTVNGLARIGVPTKVCEMLLMTHRYIFVLLHEARRMSCGMRVRGFAKRTDLETMRVLGNFVGMLLVRSIDRTERVYQAMLARGFTGSFPVYHVYQSQTSDWVKTFCWLTLSCAFVLFDHFG